MQAVDCVIPYNHNQTRSTSSIASIRETASAEACAGSLLPHKFTLSRYHICLRSKDPQFAIGLEPAMPCTRYHCNLVTAMKNAKPIRLERLPDQGHDAEPS